MSSLPKLDVGKFSVKLPSDGRKKLSFRPFTVKEEKMILMLKSDQDKTNTIRKLVEVMQSCCLTPDTKLEKLPIIDIEYILLQLRINSVEETAILEHYHPHENLLNPDETCPPTPISINLNDIEIEKSADFSPIVQLTKDISIEMRPITLESLEKINMSALAQEVNSEDEDNFDTSVELLASIISKVYHGDSVIDATEETPEDVIEWVIGMKREHIEKLEEYFHNMPKIVLNLKYKCTHCNKEIETKIEGLQNFF